MATVISREIGSTGYYSTPQAWEDDRPADMVAADEQWDGLLQNQLFTGSGPIITISGCTTNATCFARLTTASGASFIDHASFSTNPLRADSTKGAMIQKTGGYGDDAVVISEDYAKISKIQVIADDASGLGARAAIKIASATAEIDSVIAESYRANYGYGTINSLGGIIRNSLIVMRKGGADAVVRCINSETLQIYNSTIVVPSDVTAAGQGVRKNYGSVTLKNVSVFGCTNDVGGSGGSFSISNCATDDASPTTGFTGSLVYADQFEAVADATRDFRLKTGSSLFDLGVTDATNAPTDMLGYTRPVGASDIGPIETAAVSSVDVPIGLATETESAQPVTIAKQLTLAQVVETETALTVSVAIAGSVSVPIDQAVETETALAVSISNPVELDIAIETETAFDVTISQPIQTDVIPNNTGTPRVSEALVYTWLPAGRIGILNGVTPADGTGSTDANGRFTLDVPKPGILMLAFQNTDATDDDVYYEAFN
jgi:hypothetical protein